jgi:hypothetical protein
MEKYYPVTATRTLYPATQAGGEQALRDLEAALAQGKVAMVAYPVAIVWTGAGIGYLPEKDTKFNVSDHAAVVTEVDLAKAVVYVDDSSMTEDGQSVGKGKQLPIGVFLAG